MIGLLLANLGTPEAPTPRAVRRFLREFLSDPAVIDIHPFLRSLLLNYFILPFRPRRVAHQYGRIWTPKGSPLLVHSRALQSVVQRDLENSYVVELGMRYGRPSIYDAIKGLLARDVSEIRLLPLFPQHAEASRGSVITEFRRVLTLLDGSIPVRVISPFFDHPGYIKAIAEIGRPLLQRARPDKILFSFHGLPERRSQKADAYRDQCYATARLVAEELQLENSDWTVTFQSRMRPMRWIGPFTDRFLLDCLKTGKRRFLVFSPAFVADCLETVEEIGIRLRNFALAHGAESLDLVPSLNTHPRWVEAVCEMADHFYC